jgi:hypothetical protein
MYTTIGTYYYFFRELPFVLVGQQTDQPGQQAVI